MTTVPNLIDALAGDGPRLAWVTAPVMSVDIAARRVTVMLDGTPIMLRCVAGHYRPGDYVIVVRDPQDTGAGQYVAGVVSTPAPLWRTGTVTAIDSTNNRLTVTVDGTSYTLPHTAGTYTVSGSVVVLMDFATAAGHIVLGPLGNPPAAPPPPATPPPTPIVPTTKTATALIRPTWSGTYRYDRAAWDRWNTDTYGGRSDLYQGASPYSGSLRGLATYGNQITGLGALSIEQIRVTLLSNGAGYNASNVYVVQGSTNGTPPAGAPTASGNTHSSGSIARVGGSGSVLLDATTRESFRTGALKGLVVVGTDYAGLFGTSRADGMALAITYTRAA